MDLIELVDASMPWGREALCAQEPYSDWTWVTEPSMGRENPAAAVKLLEVCERCPVRAPCLRIALEEIRFDVYGAWGGTMRTERHQVTTVIRTSEEMAYADTRAEHVEHAFELLFHTLPARLNGWRHLAKLHRIEMARTGSRTEPPHPAPEAREPRQRYGCGAPTCGFVPHVRSDVRLEEAGRREILLLRMQAKRVPSQTPHSTHASE